MRCLIVLSGSLTFSKECEKLKYLPTLILLLSAQVFSSGSYAHVDTAEPVLNSEERTSGSYAHVDTVQYDDQIKKIKYLGFASVELANKRIDIEITNNRIIWVQSGKQDFDAYLNQGIAFLHVFHYIDALRSFKMAHQINPQSLYPVAGMILSYVNLSSHSIPFVERLLLISKGLVETATEREKLWYKLAASIFIDRSMSFVLRYKYPDFKAPATAYSDLLEFDPNDVETLTLASYMTSQYSEETLLKALEIQPLHIGANHYLTHLKESMGKSSEAFRNAQIFFEQAPYSAHAIHMLGHILPEVGNWSEAKKSFQKANEIHLGWAERNEVSPGEDWHYAHNRLLLAVTQIALGEFSEARESLVNLCFSENRLDACLHFFSLNNIIGNLDELQIEYDRVSSRFPRLASYLQELMDEIKLLKGFPFKRLPPENQRSRHLALVNQIIQSHKTTDPALKLDLIHNIERYIQTSFPQNGFDSWSEGLFNSLRILSVTARIKDKETYKKTLSFLQGKANEFNMDLYWFFENSTALFPRRPHQNQETLAL